MPIFHRLFLAFFLAVLIPDLIILTMSIIYTKALLAHGMTTGQIGPFIIGTLLALVFPTGVVVCLGYLMNSTITLPLSQLAALSKRIRQGETSARAPIVGHDEIAVVAMSINSMLDNIVQLVQETQGQHDYLQNQIDQLINEVSGVGEGDLSVQAEVTADTLGVLADSFNYMVEELSNLVIHVKQVAVEVETSTIATQQEMLHLVTTADKQLQQTDTAARTIEAMADVSLQVAERIQVLDHAARGARQASQNGRKAIQETLKRIEQLNYKAQQTALQIKMLEDRSREIDELVGTIDNIAHQTNRLALDAAIQVALAGESNKTGFGVVADGIRRLSEQSKVQLNTIAHNMKSVRSDIVEVAGSIQETESETATGATRIQETGKSLSTIFSLVEQQAGEIEAINQMTEQLQHSSRAITQIIVSISDITRQNSNTVRTVSQKMQKLTFLANQLRTSVEVFKLKDTTIATRQWDQHAEAR